ncbi:uncharacterized protein LOC131143910 [Malania oleifera]|uniref:uncharacterized protein LOC131143910 n=1 Tax=Malania oleifera TaxID=397392 RepID=UPI0025AEBDF8|nr:uncharacterized protein LOC131143910 [Malania oleifera]
MDAEEVLKLFDSCWFELEILKKESPVSNSEANPDEEFPEEPSKPEISRLPTVHVRSMSDQLGSTTSFELDCCASPRSGLFTPSLQTILSGKEAAEVNSRREGIGEGSPEKVKQRGRRRRKRGLSKSLSDLEFEELKGFMDLGFVFSEEDLDSGLAFIVPGLQRLVMKEGEEEQSIADESAVRRPYLSEAWGVLDRRKKENPLMNWRIPVSNNEIDMKDNLRWWAHTVASTVK